MSGVEPMRKSPAMPPRVVIVGAGFGGLFKGKVSIEEGRY